MNNFKYLPVILAALMVVGVAACSGGGGRRILGERCPGGDYKLFPDTLPANQHKIDLSDAANEKLIPPGVYTYQGATLYYKDVSDLRLALKDVKQKDGKTFVAGVTCTRNAQKPLSQSFVIEGIQSFTVSKDNKMLAGEVKGFSLKDVATQLTGDAKTVQGKSFNSPSEVYKDLASEYYLLTTDNDNTHYEIRSTKSDSLGTYYLIIYLTRADEPKTP